jgi:hypothetical protein
MSGRSPGSAPISEHTHTALIPLFWSPCIRSANS